MGISDWYFGKRNDADADRKSEEKRIKSRRKGDEDYKERRARMNKNVDAARSAWLRPYKSPADGLSRSLAFSIAKDKRSESQKKRKEELARRRREDGL